MIEQFVLSEIMELEVEMNSLEISHKKRRLSGILKKPPVVMDDSTLEPFEEPNQSLLENINQINMESPNGDIEDSKSVCNSAALRRSSRKRSATAFWDVSAKDEKIVSPVKYLSLEENPKEIEKLYLNRSIKRLNPSLETIFEVPENKKVMSSRKFRRALNFADSNIQNRHKAKKRVMKAKKITKHITKQKVTMSFLMQKLADIETDD